jgi:hypothetical protein
VSEHSKTQQQPQLLPDAFLWAVFLANFANVSETLRLQLAALVRNLLRRLEPSSIFIQLGLDESKTNKSYLVLIYSVKKTKYLLAK